MCVICFWIGGFIDVLLPSLHHGIPVVACRFKKFDPELAFALISKHNIRNMFLPPTALKLMKSVPDTGLCLLAGVVKPLQKNSVNSSYTINADNQKYFIWCSSGQL